MNSLDMLVKASRIHTAVTERWPMVEWPDVGEMAAKLVSKDNVLGHGARRTEHCYQDVFILVMNDDGKTVGVFPVSYDDEIDTFHDDYMEAEWWPDGEGVYDGDEFVESADLIIEI